MKIIEVSHIEEVINKFLYNKCKYTPLHEYSSHKLYEGQETWSEVCSLFNWGFQELLWCPHAFAIQYEVNLNSSKILKLSVKIIFINEFPSVQIYSG